LIALAELLHLALTLYMYIVIARAVISWFHINPNNPIVQFLIRSTEPPLAFIRRYVPTFAGLDFSPVILIFAVIFVDRFLVTALYRLSY